MKKIAKLPLVNAHTHAAMVAFRGVAEDLSLHEWLNDHIWPLEKKNVNHDFVYKNTKAAIAEMKKNGIRAFADMYFFEDQVARAAEELGMHVLVGEAILDFPSPSYKKTEEAFEITERLLKKYKNNKFVKVAVAPHSIFTVGEKKLERAAKLAKKYDAPIHAHLAETKREFDDCMAKNKLTPVGYADKRGLLNEKTILAHCVWLTDEDIQIIAKRGSKVVHCPISNLKLGSGIAPVAKMHEAGITVAIGTDGAASSNRLDVWEAGKFAALLQKGTENDPRKISAKVAIRMMTVNGLKALGLDSIDGKSIANIEKEIENIDSQHLLYEAHANEIFQ
ncbi:MAG: amidohydrolase [Candidatus Moranbacteria bacterium]|nr:amidohydrolase [Candidatus Moranbacteria bacterium]